MKHLLNTSLLSLAIVLLSGCGRTAVHADIWTAAATNDTEAIRQYIDSGADIDAREPMGGSSALIVASLVGNAEAAELLLENGADPNLQNNDGSTALHTAAFFCNREIVGKLLAHGARLDIKNKYQQTPYETVAGTWNRQMEELYGMLGAVFKMELDMDHIRASRPLIADYLSSQS